MERHTANLAITPTGVVESIAASPNRLMPRWSGWRILLLGVALYTALMGLWLQQPNAWTTQRQSHDRSDVRLFESTSVIQGENPNLSQDHKDAATGLFSAEADAEFALQFEDPELTSTLELLDPPPKVYTVDIAAAELEEDPLAMADAEERARLAQPLPTDDGRKREFTCMGWRNTGYCSPDGPRLPSRDLPCSEAVPTDVSGYCEVRDEVSGERFRVMRRHCSSMTPQAEFRCSDAKDFASFPEKAREGMLETLKSDAFTLNLANSTGDGILMVVYPQLLVSAYASLRLLRDVLGCVLPVEIWYIPQELSNFPAALDQLKLLATRDAANLSFHAIEDPDVAGFNSKIYALCHSQFERVLFLDADNVPTRDPSFLFKTDEFLDTGALFWPDFWHPGKTIFNIRPQSLLWEFVGLPFVNMFEQESGQLLIDRRRHAAPMALAHFYAFHPSNLFERLKLAYGDKDLFRLAWLKLHASFHMIQTPPAIVGKIVDGVFCGLTMGQYDFDGELLFLHRNSHKLTGQPTEEPPEADGFPDAAVWTHFLSLRKSSRRADYVVEPYTAQPQFLPSQNCYGQRIPSDAGPFELQAMANKTFAGLETDVRRYAAEAAQLHQKQMETLGAKNN